MSLSTKYSPQEVENKWYQHWLDQGFFHSEPNEKKSYTIVIPPPNVTGVLHMGHMLNNTIQDVLIRRARMQGFNACWVPGTDHASIATESKVVARLASQGIKKSDLTRDEFLKHAFEWKDEHGGIILKQLKRLGASCDWDRTTFTMDEGYSKDVVNAFVDLFNKGKIYRGVRMVNWDPAAKTALSDEEVNHTEENSKLYHVRYQIEGQDEFVTIATTRPETILGDTAICINPNDERYTHLKGKKVIVPLVGRVIPIIFDTYVDMEFGTGCLKVTPAHDINDYELGIKHDLEVVEILDDAGCLNEAAQLYIGEDRFVVRKKIKKDLEASGNLVDVEEYKNKVGRSERTNAIIEPKISTQWFCNMKELAAPALENVMNDTIQFFPENAKNTYRHWMENIKDWCVSRQLWWGHRIPAFYYGTANNDFVVANTVEEALDLAKEKSGNKELSATNLRQDEDVLDTWFSSWLWPMSVFQTQEEQDYYYPTKTIVTGPDIMFFWVARMIMAGYEYKGEKPFDNVYFTGLIRDKQRRKMSKSLGNSPEALKLIDDYGADGVRSGLLLTSAAGNDLLFQDEEKDGITIYPQCEQGRNFANKIWNAFRLVKLWDVDETLSGEANEVAVDWFDAKLNATLIEINDHFDKYRISDALLSTYKLIWDDFCAWYLEMIKPVYGQPIDKKTYEATIEFLEKLMKLLHPFMPFITEEIWNEIKERTAEDCVVASEWPEVQAIDQSLLDLGMNAFEMISNVRNVRNQKQISPKEALSLSIKGDKGTYEIFEGMIQKLANLSEMTYVTEKVENAVSFLIKADECFVPLEGMIDVEKELANLSKELKHAKGLLISVDKKLSNERFVGSAPEKVVAIERKKKADAEAKIKTLEEAIAGLS